MAWSEAARQAASLSRKSKAKPKGGKSKLAAAKSSFDKAKAKHEAGPTALTEKALATARKVYDDHKRRFGG